jgi:hypothetical protein
MNSLKLKTEVTVIITWKKEILQRIFGPRKENDAELSTMTMTTTSKWVLTAQTRSRRYGCLVHVATHGAYRQTDGQKGSWIMLKNV